MIWYPQPLEQGKAQGSPSINVYGINKGMNESTAVHMAVSVHSQFDLMSPSTFAKHIPSTSMLGAQVARVAPATWTQKV